MDKLTLKQLRTIAEIISPYFNPQSYPDRGGFSVSAALEKEYGYSPGVTTAALPAGASALDIAYSLVKNQRDRVMLCGVFLEKFHQFEKQVEPGLPRTKKLCEFLNINMFSSSSFSPAVTPANLGFGTSNTVPQTPVFNPEVYDNYDVALNDAMEKAPEEPDRPPVSLMHDGIKEEGLDAILAVASKRHVYDAISSNLIPIKTHFRRLIEKYNADGDLAWLRFEKEYDEQTRVRMMFQDAWNKNLLVILGETLEFKLKKIHSMFGNLFLHNPDGSGNRPAPTTQAAETSVWTDKMTKLLALEIGGRWLDVAVELDYSRSSIVDSLHPGCTPNQCAMEVVERARTQFPDEATFIQKMKTALWEGGLKKTHKQFPWPQC